MEFACGSDSCRVRRCSVYARCRWKCWDVTRLQDRKLASASGCVYHCTATCELRSPVAGFPNLHDFSIHGPREGKAKGTNLAWAQCPPTLPTPRYHPSQLPPHQCKLKRYRSAAHPHPLRPQKKPTRSPESSTHVPSAKS